MDNYCPTYPSINIFNLGACVKIIRIACDREPCSCSQDVKVKIKQYLICQLIMKTLRTITVQHAVQRKLHSRGAAWVTQIAYGNFTRRLTTRVKAMYRKPIYTEIWS